MNSDLEKRAPSNDLQHKIEDFDAYAAAEGVDTFYGENEDNYNKGNEGEVEGEFIDNKESHAVETESYSKGSLLDIVFVGKEREEEEEEEETRDFQNDTFSLVKYEQTRFRYAPLSDEERQKIIQKIKDLFTEAKVLMIVNKFLHKNYIDINRKSPSMANALDKFDETAIFEDIRYQATLENFAQTRKIIDERTASLTTELEQLESSCDSAKCTYAELFDNLLSQQLAIAKKTKPAKFAKEVWLTQVEQYLENQRQRAGEVAKIRLAHVHLQGKLAKLMAKLKQFDSLGPGFSMMDYEYLLRRKDLYSERRDEQRENMKKLNAKNLTCAVIIRHIDEETDLYNEQVMRNLNNFDMLVNGNKCERAKAVELAKFKVAISKDIGRLKEQISLLNYPFLLRKMERDLRDITKLKMRTDSLQAKLVAGAKEIAECHL